MDKEKCNKAIKDFKMLEKQLDEANARLNFVYENMGMVDTKTQKQKDRILEQMNEIGKDGQKYC